MSQHIVSNLSSVLTNIQGQKANIEANLAAARQASLVASPEEQAAIDLLVSRYKDVQVIGKIIGAQMAIKQLEQANIEVGVLEVALAAAVSDDAFVARVVQQMSANTLREAANS